MSATSRLQPRSVLTRSFATEGYWRVLWASDDFYGHTLAKCVEVIHGDIVGVWNFPDKDKVCLLFPFQFFLFHLRVSVLVEHSV